MSMELVKGDGFPGGSGSRESTCYEGDLGSTPGLGRSPGEGHGNPLWYSCLENPMHGWVWRATVHGVAKHWTWLSNWAHTAISSSPAPFLLSPQHQGLFLWVDSSRRWPKYWRFSFSSSRSSENSGLISFGSPWLVGLLAVLGTLKSLLQDHNSKASILQCSAIFMGQLTHLYITTGTTIALTIQTIVSKVLSLFSNILFAFVIASLPQSKCLLMSWLQLESAVILDPEEIKYVTTSTFSSYICHEVMRPDTMIF